MNSMNHDLNNRQLPLSGASHHNTLTELETLKLDLLKAEVKLAKARATVVGAEIDVKVATARLKELSK